MVAKRKLNKYRQYIKKYKDQKEEFKKRKSIGGKKQSESIYKHLTKLDSGVI